MNAKRLLLLVSILISGVLPGMAQGSADDATPALALVVVYDGSGSMGDRVPDANGRLTQKYLVANNAVVAIAKKVSDYCNARHVTVDAGLVLFNNARISEAVPLGRFESKRFENWAASFHTPAGGTPLGDGIARAQAMLSKSKAIKRHILIVTDGESNKGEPPASVVKRVSGQGTSVYFVAFDVAAKVFNPVKKLGATVVSASNEIELKTQVDSLLGKKILLEAE